MRSFFALLLCVCICRAQTNIGPIVTTTIDQVGKATAPNVPAPGRCRGYYNSSTGNTTWLDHNGTYCGPAAGGGDIFSAPGGSQSIRQPQNTSFNPNIQNQVRYATNFNWLQSPVSPGVIAPGSVTITINSILGVSAYSVSKVKHYVWIAGTGTPERMLITATTCTGTNTGTPCTITGTATQSHSAGYSVGSATAGWQEAFVDAFPVVTGSNPIVASKLTGSPTNNNANIYLFNAPLDIDMQRGTQAPIVIDGQGSTISCNTSGLACLMIDTGTAGTLNLQPEGLTISNFLIIPAVGMGRTADGTTVAIHDEGQKTKLHNIHFGFVNSSDVFDDLTVVDDDQMFTADRVIMNPGNGPPLKCDSTYCGFGLKGTSLAAGALGYVTASDFSMQCNGNGIDWQSGNTLHVNDTVIQAFNQIGVRAKGAFDVNPAVMLTNVYNEIGNCTNPMGTGQAGLIIENGWGRGEGNVGPGGQLAAFTASAPGATIFAYYVVVKSSTLGTSSAFLAGKCSTNGTGSCTVKYPQVGSAGTITYDLLRIQQNPLGATAVSPYTAICTGGSAATCGSVQTGITTASCAASLAGNTCTVTDSDVTASTSSYTVSAPSYSPLLSYWPGAVVLGPSSDTNSTHNGSSTYWVTDRISGGGIVSAAGSRAISVIAQNCNGLGSWSSGFVSCLVPDTTTGQISPARIAMMGANPSPTSRKGIVINEFSPVTTSGPTDLYTWADSNPDATAGTSTNRPNSDANDTAIGLDQANAASSLFRLGYRAPVGHRWYVGHIFDNASWTLDLSSTLFSSIVPYRNVAVAAPTGSSGSGWLWYDSTDTRWDIKNGSNTKFNLSEIVASGTSALGTSGITSGTCATVVTTSATNTLTTDVIAWSFSAAPSTGYTAGLNVLAYTTANNVNFLVCNATAGTLTPAAATLNWQVKR